MGKLEELLIVASLTIIAHSCTKDSLQMVQIVSKHCSMAPSFTYPQDPNPVSVWTEGLDDLTMLGKFQAYALGVFLRHFYGDFISSDPRELEVFSSGDKGVAKSAQSLVTALYSPSACWEVVQNFSWQPIYINYDNDDGQFLSKYHCPLADVELKRVASRETGALLQTYKSLLNYWSMSSGMHLKNVADVEQLFEILLTECAHNLTIPEWSQAHWNELKYFHHVSTSLKTKTLKSIKLQGGLLIEKLMNTMRAKTIHDEDPRKVVVYSTNLLQLVPKMKVFEYQKTVTKIEKVQTHNNTYRSQHTAPLLALLAALDFKDFHYLPPCSSLIIEQYKEEEEYFVRFLFINSTAPQREPQEIYSFSMPGCMEFCPLDYVIEYTRDCILKNEEECYLI